MINMRIVRENAKVKCGISNINEVLIPVNPVTALGGLFAGGVVGGIFAFNSRERENWKKLEKQEKLAIERINKKPNDKLLRKKLADIIMKKEEAYRKYSKARAEYIVNTAIGGSIGSGVAGLAL